MKRLRFTFYIGMALSVILAACAPKAVPPTPTPVVIVVTATEAAPTDTPTLVPVPVEASATPTLVPVVLAGPEMAVGSKYPYIDGTTLIAVPAGPFTMGRGGGTDNPEHQVTLPDFWIYSTKVTNQQYAYCVAAGLCTLPNLQDNQGYNDYARLNDPVVGVTYDQAAAYCDFVHGRLPTEAEWEKTARGPNGNIYPWGNGAPNAALLNYNNNVGQTTNVLKYGPGASFYGGLDLEGNTFEWVADWYDPYYYRDPAAGDTPLGPKTGLKRSVRSSGYKSGPDQVPSSIRFYDDPKNHRRDLGFRCVVEDPTYFAPNCTQIGFYGGDVNGVSNPGQICPANVSLTVAPQACGSNKTYVTFNTNQPDHTFTGGVGTCTLISGSVVPPIFPQVYDCGPASVPGPATINAFCNPADVLGPATCPPHYTSNGAGGCTWDGTGTAGTECLPNMTYDPVNQCCTSTPGTYAADFPLCQVGASPVPIGPGVYGCLIGLPGTDFQSQPISMPSECGGNDNGGCNVNPNSCQYGFNAANCCCNYTPGCPYP